MGKKSGKVMRIDESLEHKIKEFGKKNNLINKEGKVMFRESSKEFAEAYDKMLKQAKIKSSIKRINF